MVANLKENLKKIRKLEVLFTMAMEINMLENSKMIRNVAKALIFSVSEISYNYIISNFILYYIILIKFN